jgi:N-acetylglucosaminyldiphosphoundecaprenol N-acetyl-beta-D-mannosaminyltransferase
VNRIEILGVPVDAVTEVEAVDWVTRALANDRPYQVATVNPEFVMRARRDPEFAGVLRRADLCLPDGAGLLWAARRTGRPLPARVAGVDFIRALAATGVTAGWRFFFLGAGPGVAEAAADVLRHEHPGLRITGTYAGSPDPATDAATVDAVRRAGADVVLVAYGAPAQDIWIARNLPATGARLGIGVGGAFDFIAGRARRAPGWMQARGLEWLHRLAHQPWRWRRMLALPHFVARVVWESR